MHHFNLKEIEKLLNLSKFTSAQEGNYSAENSEGIFDFKTIEELAKFLHIKTEKKFSAIFSNLKTIFSKKDLNINDIEYYGFKLRRNIQKDYLTKKQIVTIKLIFSIGTEVLERKNEKITVSLYYYFKDKYCKKVDFKLYNEVVKDLVENNILILDKKGNNGTAKCSVYYFKMDNAVEYLNLIYQYNKVLYEKSVNEINKELNENEISFCKNKEDKKVFINGDKNSFKHKKNRLVKEKSQNIELDKIIFENTNNLIEYIKEGTDKKYFEIIKDDGLIELINDISENDIELIRNCKCINDLIKYSDILTAENIINNSRIYSWISNIKSEIRNRILFHKEETFFGDLSMCHPYFTFFHLITEDELEGFTELQKTLKNVKKLIISGDMKKIIQSIPPDPRDKDSKISFLALLYHNCEVDYKTYRKEFLSALEEKVEGITKLISHIKNKYKDTLYKICYKYETLFVLSVFKYLQASNVPAFNVHDAVYVRKSDKIKLEMAFLAVKQEYGFQINFKMQ